MEEKKITIEVRNPYIEAIIDARHKEAKSQMMTVGICIAGAVLYFLHYFLSDWYTYQQPYKFIVGFYYYVLIWPFLAIRSFYRWLGKLELTSFHNLNGVIDVLLCIGFTILLWKLLKYLVKRVLYLPSVTIKRFNKLFFAPAILGLSWAVFLGILRSIAWLFS